MTAFAEPKSKWVKPEIGQKLWPVRTVEDLCLFESDVHMVAAVSYPESYGQPDNLAFERDGWWIMTDKTMEGVWFAQNRFREEESTHAL